MSSAAKKTTKIIPPRQQTSSQHKSLKEKNRAMLIYIVSIVTGMFGLTYASVPLYKIFCQATGFGGTTQKSSIRSFKEKIATMEEHDNSNNIEKKKPSIVVHFTSSVASNIPWTFRPQQQELTLVPGETALAFYTAINQSDKPLTGVATYNVHPPKAGLYFNKIQCFCFEEQRLKAREEIDMPVFFFIDPEIMEDPTMNGVHNITLSYTFFKTDFVENDNDKNMKIDS